MAEERGAPIPADRLESRIDSIENRLSRIEGLLEGFRMAFDQMDKRLSTMQWGIGVLFIMQVAIFGKLFLK